jgi:hypothetical protein
MEVALRRVPMAQMEEDIVRKEPGCCRMRKESQNA